MNETNQRRLFTWLTEEQNNKIWDRAESFSSDPIQQEAKATELWQGYMKKKQQKANVEQSANTSQNLFMYWLDASDPEVQNKYFNATKVEDMSYELKRLYSDAGADIWDLDWISLINFFTQNNPNTEWTMSEYLFWNKLWLSDALVKMNVKSQKEPTWVDRIKSVVKDFFTNYVWTPVRYAWEWIRWYLDNTIGVLDWNFREDSAFTQYINDKYWIWPVELPQQLQDIEKDEFNANSELKSKYMPNLADASLDTAIWLTDAFYKNMWPVFAGVLTAASEIPLVGNTLEFAVNSIWQVLTYDYWANPLHWYKEQLGTEEKKKEFEDYVWWLGFAKILWMKGKWSWAKAFSKDWFNYNFNPKEIISRFAERYEGIVEWGLNKIKNTAIEWYNEWWVLWAWKKLWDWTFDLMSDTWEGSKQKAYDSTIWYAKELWNKTFKSLVDSLFKKKWESFVDKVEDWGKSKIEESPTLMKWIKEGVESWNLPNAWKVIEDQIKLSDKFAKDFEKTTGKKYWDYLNDEWLYWWADWWKTISNLEKRFIWQLEHLDEAFSKIEWTFKDDVFTEMAEAVAKDAKKSYSRTSKIPAKWEKLAEKSKTEWLTPKEIRSIKQYFEKNNKLDYKKISAQWNSQSYRKAIDIDSRVRTKLYEILEQYNFEEASTISKEIQASKMLLDAIWELDIWAYWSLKWLSLSDIVWLGNGNITPMLAKTFIDEIKSAWNHARYVDLVNKATWHKAKWPTRWDLWAIESENFKQEYIEKPVEEMMSKQALPEWNPTWNEWYNSVNIDLTPIKVWDKKNYINNYEWTKLTTATYQPDANIMDKAQTNRKLNSEEVPSKSVDVDWNEIDYWKRLKK